MSQFAAPSSAFTPVPGTGPAPVESLPYLERLLQDPLQWGPFRLYLSLNYGFSYSDGLLTNPGETGITVRHTVTPAFVLQSRHVTLSYSPSFTYYAKGPYGDSLNQNASVRTGFGYGDWNFGLSHSYSSGTQVLVETARETETTSQNSSLTAGYRMSARTSLDLSTSRSESETSAADLNSSVTYSSMNWFNYQVSDRTRLGLGGGGGFTESERGSDMTYQQIQARIIWTPRPKITASVNGGIEFRQFTAAEGANDRTTPIMGASATYRPFDQTSLSLSADRSVNASVLTDQITETTSLTLALRQRLLERFQAGLSASVRDSNYESSSRFLEVDRSDTVTSYTASLSTGVFKKGSISVSYTLSQNDSSDPRYSYDGYSVGVNFGYRF